MLDLNPSDMSCVYSTLQFVAVHARNLNMTPIVTFDQPLYWKALCIVTNEPHNSEIKSMIVRLGGFHTEMSFLGCSGLGNCGTDQVKEGDVHYVLDVGSLVHRIPWAYGAKLDSICEDYVNLVIRNYGLPYIVFDGYSNGPTTKDTTHERRTKGVVGTRVIFDEQTTFKSKKDQFLSNQENKQDFINLLGLHMKNKGCKVTHAPDDADVLIPTTAVNEAGSAPTIVIGEDTDVLVLLCYYANNTAHNIYYTSGVKSGTKKKKIWDINRTRQAIGLSICELLPTVHAFSGCDTTSHIYGVGKGVLLKKAMSDSWFRDQTSVFHQEVSHNGIEKAGESIFVSLFNGEVG